MTEVKAIPTGNRAAGLAAHARAGEPHRRHLERAPAPRPRAGATALEVLAGFLSKGRVPSLTSHQ